MVRVELSREKKVEFVKGQFVESNIDGYQVYITCEGLTAWVRTVNDLEELDNIFCNNGKLEELLLETLSEAEYDVIWQELRFHGGYYNHKKELIRF